MLILFGKGPGPHGSSHAGILSGPLFVVVADVAGFRGEAEHATNSKGLTSLWVSQADWDQLVMQSAQARGVTQPVA